MPARGDRKLRARAAADDDVELVSGGAFAEQDFAGGVLAPLEQRAKLLAFLRREAREQAELLERVFAARRFGGSQLPDQIVLGPLERVVGVGELGAHRGDDSHSAKHDLDMRRGVDGSEQQVRALRLEPFVRLQQDARAGAVQVVDAPEIQHHVPHPGGERGIDPLGERFGRAEEYRPFELEQHDAAAVRVEQGGFRGGARAARTHLVAVLLAAHDRAAHAQHEQHHRHADADQHGDRDVAGDCGPRDREDHREIERGRVPVRPVPREHLAHELQRPPVDELHPRDDEDGADHDERQLGELRRERGDDGENHHAMDEKDQRSARAGLVARGRWAHADAAADAAQERRDQVRAADQAQHAVRRGALAGDAFDDARADKRVERGDDRQAEGKKKEGRQHVDRGAVNGERQHGAEVIPVRAAPGDGA